MNYFSAVPDSPRLLAVSSFRSNSSNLDIIRAVAVMSVFFAHLRGLLMREESLTAWHFAQMGVLTFFVHTSMVLMFSLERTQLFGRDRFLSFYLRRIFRIYPLSIFCVTVAMVTHRTPDILDPFAYWTGKQYFVNLALLTNLFYVRNMVGGLWTLPIEVQMYVTLPFLFLLGRRWGLCGLMPLWILSVPLAMLQLHYTQRLNMLGFAPCFIGGVISWNLSTRVPRRLPGWLWPFAFVATWPVFFAAQHETDMPFRWAFCFLLGLSIPWFQEINCAPLQWLAHVLAKYSYGVYLSHIGVILWCFSLPVPRVVQWVVFLPLAFVVPFALFHLVEDPMIKAGQRLSNRMFRDSSAITLEAGADTIRRSR